MALTHKSPPLGRNPNLLNSSAMSTFVLVHGAWQSTGTWDLLVPLLQKHGHRIITPVLRGLGSDQANLSSDVTLNQHIEDISATLATMEEEVVLVGHSYAGMVVSGAVELHPTRVKRLVFLDAFIPDDGQSALDLLPNEVGNHFRKIAREYGDGWRLAGGESQLDLWGLKAGAAREFVRSRLSDFSLRCFEESLHLPANRKAGIPAIFVRCTAERYPAKAFFESFARKAQDSGWQVFELQTGHDCHVEDPEGVANILLSAVKPA